MAFRRTVTVRFDEADARGILFYGRLHELAHRVYEDFVVSELVSRWEDWFLSAQFIVPIRRAEVDFFRPMRPGCEYEAELVVSRVGDSSFEVTTTFRDLNSPAPVVCAQTRVSHVFANPSATGKMSIPSGLRTKLEQHLARE